MEGEEAASPSAIAKARLGTTFDLLDFKTDCRERWMNKSFTLEDYEWGRNR